MHTLNNPDFQRNLLLASSSDDFSSAVGLELGLEKVSILIWIFWFIAICTCTCFHEPTLVPGAIRCDLVLPGSKAWHGRHKTHGMAGTKLQFPAPSVNPCFLQLIFQLIMHTCPSLHATPRIFNGLFSRIHFARHCRSEQFVLPLCFTQSVIAKSACFVELWNFGFSSVGYENPFDWRAKAAIASFACFSSCVCKHMTLVSDFLLLGLVSLLLPLLLNLRCIATWTCLWFIATWTWSFVLGIIMAKYGLGPNQIPLACMCPINLLMGTLLQLSSVIL